MTGINTLILLCYLVLTVIVYSEMRKTFSTMPGLLTAVVCLPLIPYPIAASTISVFLLGRREGRFSPKIDIYSIALVCGSLYYYVGDKI